VFSRKVKFVVCLAVGLLSACASQTTQTPASQPTNAVAPATQVLASTSAKTDTPAAAQNTPVASAATVSFSQEVMPILDSRCVNCHGGDRMEEGLNLKTYTDILSGSKNGAVVVPGDASNSLLAELIANQKMPKRGPKLTPPQVQLIVDWINQGAPDN
jgi:mono/diheme cytochrome c family protein